MIRRWGRAQFDIECAHCKRMIVDGERILFGKRIGDGISCGECGLEEEAEDTQEAYGALKERVQSER